MAHKKHKKFITDINLFLMKITLIFLTLILIIQTTTAISIHAENVSTLQPKIIIVTHKQLTKHIPISNRLYSCN